MRTTPTAEGLRRYPHSAGFNTDYTTPLPCTCEPTCATRCAGECGCAACAAQFATFCSNAGIRDAVPGSPGAADALAAYRAEKEAKPTVIIHRRKFDGR